MHLYLKNIRIHAQVKFSDISSNFEELIAVIVFFMFVYDS